MFDRGATTRTAIRLDRVLLVEGIEDARLYEVALEHIRASTCVEVRQTGGRTRLRDSLEVVTGIRPDLRAIGVIQDAREDPARTFASVQSAVAAAGLTAPTRAGVMSVAGSGPALGALIMPAGVPGGIESICWETLQGVPVAGQVDAFVHSVIETDPPAKTLEAEQEVKLRLGTLLAVGLRSGPRPLRPGLRLGEAAEVGFWDWSHPAFDPLLTFLRDLSHSEF